MYRQTKKGDIYKCFDVDLPQLYTRLAQRLGDDNPFARVQIGVDYYQWRDDRRVWKMMTEAPAEKQAAVQAALTQVRQRIAPQLGDEQTVDMLFTIPNDSYIYYSDDDGTIHILLTAWAFKASPGARGHGETGTINTRNAVTIAFCREGQAVPNYPFIATLPRLRKRLQTDDSGQFTFPNLKVGDSLPLSTGDGTRDFLLTVVAGQATYTFDITEPKPDSPEDSPQPPVEGPEEPEEPTETQTKQVIEIEPVPEPERRITVRIMDCQHRPVVCDDVVFAQEGHDDYTAPLTDGATTFAASAFSAATVLTVTIRGWQGKRHDVVIPFTLDADEDEYLLQEEKSPLPWREIVSGIVLVAVAAIGSYVLWPLVADLCNEINYQIYH